MNRHAGFTILELMTVIAIVGILITVGVPSLRTLAANNRLVSQLNQMTSSLALARSEAVKTNQRVVVCPTTTGTSCATSTDWDVGWLVFIDRSDSATDFQVDSDGTDATDDSCAIDAGDDDKDDCVLNVIGELNPSNVTLRTDASNDYISYNGLGVSNEAAMFVICDDRGDSSARAVSISTTGRASVRTTKLDGSALSCTP